MARNLRVEFSGAIYHVTIRGNAREDIFRDQRDTERFLERLALSIESYCIRLYTFCLMRNHAHLVLETPQPNLGLFMQSVQTGYAIYFNLRHRRVGHVMQGRYGAKLVEGDEYIDKLSRYVHLNPVFIKRMRDCDLKERIEYLRGYGWSSYQSYIGREKKLPFVDYGPVLGMMAGKGRQRQREYRRYVEAGVSQREEEFEELVKASPRSIGREGFREWVDSMHFELLSKRKRPEDVSFRRELRRIPAEQIVSAVASEFGVDTETICRRTRGAFARRVAAKMLTQQGGLTQREVAQVLGLSTGAAVCMQIRKLTEDLSNNSRLRRKVDQIGQSIAAMGD